MDLINNPGNILLFLKKYRAVLLVVLTGVLLMALPEREKPEEKICQVQAAPDFQQELEQLLSCISGAGKVELLLTEETGAKTVYETNEDRSGPEGDFRKDIVIISGSDRQEQGLVRQITAPRYRGAVVIAQGGENPTVRLAIKKAVSSAAGLSTDKITVLKMK